MREQEVQCASAGGRRLLAATAPFVLGEQKIHGEVHRYQERRSRSHGAPPRIN